MQRTRTFATLGLAAVVALGAGCGSSDDDDGGTGDTTTTAADAGSDDGSTGSTDPSEPVDLPEGWPEELALPDGVTPVEVSDSSTTMMVVAEIDGDVQAVFDALKAQLTEASYEIVGDTFTPTDDGGYGSISARGDTSTAALAFGPDPTGDSNRVTINVADAS